jgi:hypothetical protein
MRQPLTPQDVGWWEVCRWRAVRSLRHRREGPLPRAFSSSSNASWVGQPWPTGWK